MKIVIENGRISKIQTLYIFLTVWNLLLPLLLLDVAKAKTIALRETAPGLQSF